MKRYIVLSVDENPDYMFYLPLTAWAWKKFGWEPILISAAPNIRTRIASDIERLWYATIERGQLPRIFSVTTKHEGGISITYESAMVSQISRLYAAAVQPGYLMTGDIDMIPLSDYWNPDEKSITAWGHDLTEFNHYPICYIGMPWWKWAEIMNIDQGGVIGMRDMIIRDLDSMPNAKSEDPINRWVVDQDLITSKLMPLDMNCEIDKVTRGVYPNGYPIGRVDRSAWTLDHEKLIDCHMHRDIWKDQVKLNQTLMLLMKVFPNEDFQWFINYCQEFKRIMSNE